MSDNDILAEKGCPPQEVARQGEGGQDGVQPASSESPQGEAFPQTGNGDIQSPTGEQTGAGNSPADVSLGKFKDIQSLAKAYKNLQSEFTRKCQRLAELERSLGSAADNGEPPAPPQRLLEDGEFVERYILSNQAICDRVLEKYLRELIKSQAPATMSGVRGMMPLTPPAKPKTIYEAGKLAEKMFKNQ